MLIPYLSKCRHKSLFQHHLPSLSNHCFCFRLCYRFELNIRQSFRIFRYQSLFPYHLFLHVFCRSFALIPYLSKCRHKSSFWHYLPSLSDHSFCCRLRYCFRCKTAPKPKPPNDPLHSWVVAYLHHLHLYWRLLNPMEILLNCHLPLSETEVLNQEDNY